MAGKNRYSKNAVLNNVDLSEVEEEEKEEENAKALSERPSLQRGRSLDLSLGGSLSGKKKFEFYSNKEINFLNDDRRDMTYSRRIALDLMKYEWYNPAKNKKHVSKKKDEVVEVEAVADDDTSVQELPGNFRSPYGYPVTHSVVEHPSLEKAWAYFEHNTLTRYIDSPKPSSNKPMIVRCFRKLFCKAGKTFDKADPGENHLPTKLYHPIFTPHSQLGDFGLGIGLYFSNLRGLCVLTLLTGLFNMPVVKYYFSAEYSGVQPGIIALLRGSAICTEKQWVPCIENCSNGYFPTDRIAMGFMNNQTQVFAQRNLCNGALLRVGLVNLASVCFIILGMIVLNCYLQNMEVSYDEDEQTPQDYAVVISNPPEDATDPEEWKMFFKEKIGVRVTTLTLAVNNDLLVRSLVKRRECMKKIELKVEPGTPLNMLPLCELAAKMERDRNIFEAAWAKFSPGIPEWFGQIVVLTAKIRGLAQMYYPVTYVFCIFETEADQRKVLQRLSVGKYYSERNIKSVVPEKYLFRGELVLDIEEANEPDTIRWTDLNITFKESIIQKSLTLVATFAAIFIGTTLVSFVSELPGPIGGTYGAAQCISFLNIMFPVFAKWLTRKEAHDSETSTQTSLYFKIALFRWVNTAVVISLIIPFTSTLAPDGTISQIYNLFYSEIFTTTLIQIADGGGHFTRHFLAPRAKTQDAMNLCMKGQTIDIAERYTNMTKLFFLTVWYCSIYPAAFHMCAVALFINYFQDRFSLMRTWKRAPNLGNHISQFSRKYFLVVCIVVKVFMSSYFWSAFPYDNLCETDSVVGNYSLGNTSLVGTWKIYKNFITDDSTGSGDDVELLEMELLPTNKTYRYCSQNLLRHHHPDGSSENSIKFPFWPKNQPEGLAWMTSNQEQLTIVYGYATIFFIGLLGLYFVMKFLIDYWSYFKSSYDPQGKDQGIPYSEVPSISAYIPEVKSKVYAFPLLAADCDKFSSDLISWTDPNRAHAFYDLTKDADMLTTSRLQENPLANTRAAEKEEEEDDDDVVSDNDYSDDDDDDNHHRRKKKRKMPKLIYSQVAHWPPRHRH